MSDPSAWPDRCEVLVVGAGPAGSACAQLLARAGLDTVLVDAQAFPRDKVCGDGLIPDAHAALHKLGVYDEVMARAQRSRHVGCIGPRGGRVDVPGRLAVLPRRELDDIVCRAAVRAGARLLAPARFEAPLLEGGRVVGAQLRGRAGGPDEPAAPPALREIRARQVVLATGAVPQALIAAGVCERRVPSGVALRGYVRNPAFAGRITALEVVWHKRLRQGYGWIFPCRDGVFNIGVGLAHSHSQLAADGRQTMREVNLREMFAAFCAVYAPARELTEGGEFVGELKGAPLRCSLEGAQLTRAGLMVTGEAAGSTYAFTGEGIGKAMETGMLAARALIDAHAAAAATPGDAAPATAPDDGPDAAPDAALDAAHAPYRAAIGALKPRFDLYERANRVNNHPWLADLLIWRANRSPRILQRMAGVLEETGNPGNLVSMRGIARLLLPLR